MADSVYPLLMMLGVAVTVAASMLVLSALLGRPESRLAKGVDISPYECGAKPFEAVERHRFSVKFYLVATLFILFDIETAFLVPWAATFQSFTEHKKVHRHLRPGALGSRRFRAVADGAGHRLNLAESGHGDRDLAPAGRRLRCPWGNT